MSCVLCPLTDDKSEPRNHSEYSGNSHKGKYRLYGNQVACISDFLYNCGTGIPYHEVAALAHVLLPEIHAFYESGERQWEFAGWKAKRETEQQQQA